MKRGAIVSSKKQAAANRRNALKSTGPRTPEGKALVGKNAIKHGLLAQLKVLPGLERPEDWERHLEQTVADLMPQGYMERTLAERVAHVLWRLRRAARYESEAASAATENAERQLARDELGWDEERIREQSPVEEAQERVELARRRLSVLETLGELPDDEAIPDGAWITKAAAAAIDVHLLSPEFPGIQGYPDGVSLRMVRWATWLVRNMLVAIAQTGQTTFDHLVVLVTADARKQLAEAERARDTVAVMLDQYRRRSILPGEPEVEKVRRYEAHLERAFYKALHELQRLQAARDGGAPAPAALDVTVTGSASEK